ncbi:hypothetical protein HMPREF0240_02139 [Clostridium sp. D5]|nr:hypothetical protein HMPREF0240_02139 [Clostridium sp. D5]
MWARYTSREHQHKQKSRQIHYFSLHIQSPRYILSIIILFKCPEYSLSAGFRTSLIQPFTELYSVYYLFFRAGFCIIMKHGVLNR